MSETNGIIERRVPATPQDGKTVSATDGIRVNVSGNVTTRDQKGNVSTTYLAAGADYPYVVTEVLATGTDANLGIVLLYFSFH